MLGHGARVARGLRASRGVAVAGIALLFAALATGGARWQATAGAAPQVGDVWALLAPGSLAGLVYVDLNSSGSWSPGEPGINGAVVNLTGTATGGASVDRSFTTGPDGTYSFADLPAGTYTLSEVQPAAYNDAQESAGTLDGTVANDQISDIVLPDGGSGTGYNFGEVSPPPGAGTGSLSGIVYLDLNASGAYNLNEPGIPAVGLTLSGLDTGGAPVARVVATGLDGRYSFADLPAGIYTIVESQPAGYSDGQESAGTLGGSASDNQISAIVLPAGSNGTGYNFGERITVASPSPSPAATFTPSPTRTVTPTPTSTLTPTATRTTTPTGTITVTATGSLTATLTPTRTPTPAGSASPIASPSPGAVRPLDIQKTNDKPSAKAGETVRFTITVVNPNGVPATNVVVIDNLPAGLALQGVTSTGGTVTVDRQQLTFAVGTIAPNAASILTLTTIVVAGEGPVVNVASYSATINGQTFGGNSLSGIGAPALPNTGTGGAGAAEGAAGPDRPRGFLLLPFCAFGALALGVAVFSRARRRRDA